MKFSLTNSVWKLKPSHIDMVIGQLGSQLVFFIGGDGLTLVSGVVIEGTYQVSFNEDTDTYQYLFSLSNDQRRQFLRRLISKLIQ